jgi:pullulanase
LFRIWAPTAEKAQIIFYNAGDGGESTGFFEMKKDLNGTWTAKVAGDIKERFYVFRVQINGQMVE